MHPDEIQRPFALDGVSRRRHHRGDHLGHLMRRHDMPFRGQDGDALAHGIAKPDGERPCAYGAFRTGVVDPPGTQVDRSSQEPAHGLAVEHGWNHRRRRTASLDDDRSAVRVQLRDPDGDRAGHRRDRVVHPTPDLCQGDTRWDQGEFPEEFGGR